jgi:hypothetical protein
MAKEEILHREVRELRAYQQWKEFTGPRRKRRLLE